jgi:hypothetical protein
MLRVSVSQSNLDVDLLGIRTGKAEGLQAISHAQVLIDLADAFMTRDDLALSTARDRAQRVLGDHGIIEAIGVAANFQRMVRIASATGIPIDDPDAAFGQSVRSALALSESDWHPGG